MWLAHFCSKFKFRYSKSPFSMSILTLKVSKHFALAILPFAVRSIKPFASRYGSPTSSTPPPPPWRPPAAPATTSAAVAQPQRYLTNDEAADYLRLSPRTLEKQRVLGGGPKFRKFGRRVMYAVADLDAWAAERSFESTSDPEYAEQHSADSRAR